MHTRPSVIHIKKRCMKRKTARNALLLIAILLVMVCCGVDFILSLMLSGITVVIFNIYIGKS